MRTLKAAIGRYPAHRGLLDGAVTSGLLRLEDAGIAPISRAFAPMVREARFDVSEMAIATFLQARAWGKPLVLLPVVLAARFQEAALLCRADGPIRGPADLAAATSASVPIARPPACGCAAPRGPLRLAARGDALDHLRGRACPGIP